MLKTELKKIIVSPHFIVCVVVLYVLLMIGTVGFWAETFVTTGETISLLVHFWDAWEIFGRVYTIVPLLVAVPITFLLHDELNSGYFYISVIRTGKGKYIIKKMLAGILAGMVMILFAEVLFTVTLCILTPGEIHFSDQQGMLTSDIPNLYTDLVAEGKGYLVYIIWSLMAGVYGGTLASIAVATSAVAKNKYVAVVTPFIVFLIMQNVSGYFRFLPLILRIGFLPIFYPFYLEKWMSGIHISLGIALAWVLVCTVLFWLIIRKKVSGKI